MCVGGGGRGGGRVQSLCWAGEGEGWEGGREEQEGSDLCCSVIFQSLVEEKVGCQVLVLLAGEVGLDHQSLREPQRF